MASWFTRALDRLTPWDRGGEVQRRLERKKREEEERQNLQSSQAPKISVGYAQPNQQISVNQAPKPKQPINIFEDLNKNLVFNKPQNTRTVAQPAPKEDKRGFWEKLGDRFEANSPQDIAHRQSVGEPTKYQGPTFWGQARDVAVGTGRELARIPETAVRSIDESNNPAFRQLKPFTRFAVNSANNPIGPLKQVRRFLLGSEPVKSYQQRAKGYEEAIKNKQSILNLEVEGKKLPSSIVDLAARNPKITALLAAAGLIATDVIPNPLKSVKNVFRQGVKEGAETAAEKAALEAAERGARPRPIPVRKNIPVDETIGDAFDVPVRNRNLSKPVIREIEGDAATVGQKAVNARQPKTVDVPKARPDRRIEGVMPSRPRFLGEARGVTRVELDTERAMLKEALDNKEINKTQFKEANKLLDETVPTDAPPPKGKPITVKEVKGIDVLDDTKIPQNLPETPGTVRATSSTAPSNAKSEIVAAQTPVALPKEVQAVLDNPKQYNKRQVAAARNQRRLARQMAKVQEDTAAAMSRIEASKTNPGAGQPEGFAPTGKFRRGKRGNVSESASVATEAQAGAREMADRSVDDLLDEIVTKESLTPGDRRRITAAKENLMKTDPEGFRSSEKYQILDRLEKAGRSDLGRGLALIPRTIRKTASSNTLTGRWERKIGNVLDDPAKMTDAQWQEVQGANDAFTIARDRAGALEEQFRQTGSRADFEAWEQAFKAARDADTVAKMTEVKVAKQVLRGEKGANVIKTLDELKKEADVNTMDATSAAMLSGTGTGFRNTFGTELMGIENRLGANVRAKITKGLFGENVGGFDRQGAKFGRKFGISKWAGDIKRRAEVGGKNPIEWAKNWSTTINSGGESSLQSQVYSRLAKYYKNQFEGQGLSGEALDLRMRHAMLTDPDDMGRIYLDASMKSSGLQGLFEKGQTIEKAVTDYVGRGTDSKLAQGASKLIMRMAVGFPTATGNFLYQSGKRLTLGLPSWMETGAKLAKGDKTGAAMAFDRGLKEAGSGAAMLGLGAALGSAGLVSGPYPTDPNERERWAREGVSEYSIKIGGAWYPIPQGAGMLGLPIMVGAAIGAEGDSNESLKELFSPKSLTKLLPTDQIQGFLNTMSGDESPQALKNMIASSVRAVTPVGALLNQIAKSFDPTKNDTTQHGLWHNVLDQVISGIPGVNNMVDIADKIDAEGNTISNPNAAELGFGAISDVQGGGEQRSQEINDQINSTLSQIDQYGLLSDKNMDGVLEGSALEALTKAQSGQQLDESEIKALREGLVKGVSSEGTDTAYLERGQYDTNLAVLRLKRDLMNDDPTVKPSSLEDIDVAIKRGEVYKENTIPYDLISDYKSIGVEAWRNMGDPEDEDYDPDMYQTLWDIDQLMTKAGVSYKRGALDKNKYFLREKTGRGGSGSKSIDTSFGALKSPSFAPRVRAYDTIDQQSGSIPIIRTVRPNIVHKITSSG